MKKSRILLHSLILSIFCLSNAYSDEGRKMRILVNPFKYQGNKEYSWVVAGLTDTVITDLNKIEGVNVFSNEDRQNAVKEMNLGMTGLIDESTAVQVGKAMGANIIFSGSVQVSGDKIRVNARLINVASTKVDRTIKLDGSLDDIFSLQDRIVIGLMTETEKIHIADVKPVILDDDSKKKIENKYKPSRAAYEWYSKGLSIEDSDMNTALKYFKKAAESDSGYVNPLIEAGKIEGYDLGHFDKGFEYLARAEKILVSQGTNTVDYADFLDKKGSLHSKQKDYDKALEYRLQAKEILEYLGMQESDNYSEVMCDIGVAHYYKGLTDQSIEYYRKSLGIKERLGLQNTSNYVIVNTNIGVSYDKQENYDEALSYYMKSRDILEKNGMQRNRAYIHVLDCLGRTYKKQGKYELAVENLEKHLELKDKMGINNTPDYSSDLSYMQRVYYAKGDYRKAITYGLKAKKLKETLGLQDSDGYAYTLYNLAAGYDADKDKSSAEKYFRQASNVFKKLGMEADANESLKLADDIAGKK